MKAQKIEDRGNKPASGIIEKIYISKGSGAPMVSKETATLIPGKGIDGDRYAIGTGTYSAKFMGEPGKHLTLVSSDGVREAFERTGMTPLENLGELRRNIVIKGISSHALNEMIGHEIRIGNNARAFVHRRCVPCKYREAACKRSGLMNNLWGDCGINCEILAPLAMEAGKAGQQVRVGDTVAIIPGTYQPDRVNVGRKAPGFWVRPADRSLEDVKGLITPPWIAAIASLWDPEGFRRVENAYNSVGLRFWSPDAFSLSLLAMAMRTPLLVLLSTIVVSIAIGSCVFFTGTGSHVEL